MASYVEDACVERQGGGEESLEKRPCQCFLRVASVSSQMKMRAPGVFFVFTAISSSSAWLLVDEVLPTLMVVP